jgi:hypothetical protein
MRSVLIFVFVIVGFGTCGVFAKDLSPQQKQQCVDHGVQCSFRCEKLPDENACYQRCTNDMKRCFKGDDRIDIRGTPAVVVLPGSIKMKAGAVSGTNAAVFESQGSVSPKGVIAAPAATITTTINAPPISAPAKPPTAISNGIAGHAPSGQLGRGDLRVQ